MISQIILNGIITGSLYAIVAMGFNLLYGTIKFFDIAYGSAILIGGYATFWLSEMAGFPFYLSIITALLFSGLIGFLSNKYIYEKLETKKASKMTLLVASLGVFTLIQAIIAIVFSSQFKVISSRNNPTVFNILNGFITENQAFSFFCALILIFFLVIFLKKTNFGKSIRAIGDDISVAKIVGINTKKMVGLVFFISYAMAGLAGIIYVSDIGVDPTIGMSLLLKGIIASILGGIGNIYGGFLGGFLLSFIENIAMWSISGEWRDFVSFGILVIFLIFKPRGFLGK
jgi:branched-chain amino acid transport system permease protein